MKIGIVTTFYQTVGGISTFVKNVVSHTQVNEFTPLVFSPDNTVYGLDKRLIPLDPRSRISVMVSLIRELRNNDIRFVQCHGTWYLLLACILYKYIRKLSGIEIRVITVKHSDLAKPGWIKRLVLQNIDNGSDGIVFVSSYLKKRYIHAFGFNFAKPTTIINPGCGAIKISEAIQTSLVARLGDPAQGPLLSYIGLFEYPGKVRGLIQLLEAIALLRARMPNLLLAIAGRGSLKGEVITAIERLKLQAVVQIIEDLHSPYELLQLSDLHCHISFQDNFPLVVLESLNCGTPVVASAIGELPFLDIGGLVITADDAESITEALSYNVGLPPKVDVEAVRERFDWNIVTAALNRFTIGFHA